MTDFEIFMAVLERLTEQYRLTVIRPDGDQYFELKKDERMLGAMNPDGYNLLTNLTRLCRMLEEEMR